MTSASRPRLRAGVFATVAVPVTVVAHVAGGGSPATVDVLAISFALAYVAHRLILGGTHRSLPVLAVTLAAVQGAVHALVVLREGLHMHPDEVGPMLGWHLAAAVVLGAVLHVQESRLWTAAYRAAWRGVQIPLDHCLPGRAACVALAQRVGPAVEDVLRARRAPGWVNPAPDAHRTRRRLVSGGQIRRGPPPAPCASV